MFRLSVSTKNNFDAGSGCHDGLTKQQCFRLIPRLVLYLHCICITRILLYYDVRSMSTIENSKCFRMGIGYTVLPEEDLDHILIICILRNAEYYVIILDIAQPEMRNRLRELMQSSKHFFVILRHDLCANDFANEWEFVGLAYLSFFW